MMQAPVFVGSQAKGVVSSNEWKPLEKDLYLKGIEIFGRNRYIDFLENI